MTITSTIDGVYASIEFDEITGQMLAVKYRNSLNHTSVLMVKNNDTVKSNQSGISMAKNSQSDEVMLLPAAEYFMRKNADDEWALPSDFEFGISVIYT